MDIEKKYLIGGAMLITLLLYKLGFKGYTVTENAYNKLNKANKIGLPVIGNLKLSSPFGWRSFGGGQFHNGVDLTFKNSNILGAPIVAPLSGTITENYFNDRGGNQIILNCGYAKFGFAHLQFKSPIAKGTKVKQGELIGYVGNTGTSTGPHLHFTLRLDNAAVDPIKNINTLKNAIA